MLGRLLKSKSADAAGPVKGKVTSAIDPARSELAGLRKGDVRPSDVDHFRVTLSELVAQAPSAPPASAVSTAAVGSFIEDDVLPFLVEALEAAAPEAPLRDSLAKLGHDTAELEMPSELLALIKLAVVAVDGLTLLSGPEDGEKAKAALSDRLLAKVNSGVTAASDLADLVCRLYHVEAMLHVMEELKFKDDVSSLSRQAVQLSEQIVPRTVDTLNRLSGLKPDGVASEAVMTAGWLDAGLTVAARRLGTRKDGAAAMEMVGRSLHDRDPMAAMLLAPLLPDLTEHMFTASRMTAMARSSDSMTFATLLGLIERQVYFAKGLSRQSAPDAVHRIDGMISEGALNLAKDLSIAIEEEISAPHRSADVITTLAKSLKRVHSFADALECTEETRRSVNDTLASLTRSRR